ncbi:MAG: FecR family protein [Bacteriovorax sp.]|nr:FecR family protein [Bacteriovorax sp.]
MKILFSFIIALCCLHLPAFEAKALDKDWTFDPKTSSLIPKYLGLVKVVNGKVIIGERELKKGSKIYNNDLIQTSEKSFVVIEMIDLTVVTLGPKSDFKVENWSYRTKNDRDAVFSVIKGQWRALIKSKSKDDDQLKIKTPLVSMGVRGTELMVNVNTMEGREITQVALLAGHVHLQGELPSIQQDLLPGDHAVIVKDQKGFEHRDRKLKPDEIKSYQEYTAPEVLRLLDPVILDGEKEASNPRLETEKIEAKNDSASAPKSKEEILKKKIQQIDKSLKENLEILNTTREQNLKK